MPLENMNEFTTHILEIVNAHMILRKNLMVRTKIVIPSWPFLGELISQRETFCWENCLTVGLESLKQGNTEGLTGVLASLERDCVAIHFHKKLFLLTGLKITMSL